VPLLYEVAPDSGALRQGEILGDIWEHRVRRPASQIPEGSLAEVDSRLHGLMIIMSAECDLYQDYVVRFSEQPAQEQHELGTDERHPAVIPQVLLCDLYKQEEVRPRIGGADIWKRINQNQDERYHYLKAAPIGDPPQDELPDLCLDFKKTLALPTKSLYEGVDGGQVKRVAVVPPLYIHDLVHRFYGYHSRVGLPD